MIANDDAAEPQAVTPLAAPAGSSDIGDVWRILWCRGRLILGLALAALLGASLYVAATRSEFTASAQILIDPRDRQIVSKDVTPDTLAADGGILQVESQSRVIESDAVLLRAVRALNLAGDPDYGAPKGGLATTLLNALGGVAEEEGPAAAENRALRTLRRHLSIKRADKVFVVEIVVAAYSGAKAARIADAIAEAYVADQIESRSESSIRASTALASRLEELRKGVEAAAGEVERFKASHDLLGTDRELISDQQLNDTGSQLNAARARVAELQARADQLDALRRSGADGGAMPEAIQSSVITQLRSSQSELTRRRSDMRTRFGARYPDLIAIDAEINQSRTLINAELDRLVRSAHSDLDRARKNVEALSGSQDALKRKTVSNNQAFVTLQELVRGLDARRSIYQAFLARAGETREQSGIDNTNARIISRAIPPVTPSWPLRPVILLGALGGGLGIGAAIAFVLEYAAPTLLSAGQLGLAAGAPVAGVIGRAPPREPAPFGRRGRTGADTLAGDMPLRLALSRVCGPLGALKTRPKPHTILLLAGRGIASAALAARMAGACAQDGVSVLLVGTDADDGAGASASKGLYGVLTGESTLKAAVSRDGATGIFRLGLGAPVAGGRDALARERLDNFFRLVGRNFDLVLFDGGCFSANPRAVPLAGSVDDVLFAARRGVTPFAEAAETAEAVLASTGRPLSSALLVDRPDRV